MMFTIVVRVPIQAPPLPQDKPFRISAISFDSTMQQASAAASFFPTAKELSSGVQWFKDHPVLAAAAATAVSVITYLNALEQLPEAEPEEDASRPRRLTPVRRRGSSSISRKSSGALASDGKLSAAVSWCDEHGGSLTQVFEDEPLPHIRRRRAEDTESEDETRDDVAEGFEDAFQQHQNLTGGLRKSVTSQQLDVAAVTAASDLEADVAQTESPQWGWYVPITPPQDQFHPAGRPCSGAEVVKGIRRSTSGQIA